MAERIPGIDVARYQGEPNWGAVRGAGYVFTYIKATEGIGYVSPTLDAQLNGARGAGMVTGLYHFARPDTNTPQQEAADFAAQLARTHQPSPLGLRQRQLSLGSAEKVEGVARRQRSLTDRTTALGGRIDVSHIQGRTVLNINVPL